MIIKLQSAFAMIMAAIAAIWFICVAHVYFMHDDHMYVVTAALIGQYSLYTELVFLQMPLVAYVFAALYKFFGSYTALIVFNITITLVACALALKSLPQRTPFILLAVWLALLGSFAVITTAGTTSNHALQLLFCAALLAVIFAGPATTRRTLLAGVIYSLMVQAKLNSLPFALPLAVWLWQSGNFCRYGFVAALAGLVAAIPALLLFAQNPAAFWYANITAPLLNNELRGGSSISEIAGMMGRQFAMPPVMAILLIAGISIIKIRPVIVKRSVALWCSFILAALVAGLLPGKIFDNHLAMLMLVVCTAAGAFIMTRHQHMPVSLQPKFLLFCVVPLSILGAALLSVAGLLQQVPGKAQVMTQISADYKQAISQHPTCAQQIFSTVGIPLLRGPLPLHPASASGPFIMRLQPEAVISGLMNSRVALVTGYHYDMPYEHQLVRTAQAANYAAYVLGTYKTGTRTAEWTLWLPPCN